jgi:hypothetical protein
MRCAVCQNSDGLVVNIIVADPTDPAPVGCFLVGIADDMWCDIGYTWDGTAFLPPPTEAVVV